MPAWQACFAGVSQAVNDKAGSRADCTSALAMQPMQRAWPLTCFAPAAQACLARLLQPGGCACQPAHDGPRDMHRPVAPARGGTGLAGHAGGLAGRSLSSRRLSSAEIELQIGGLGIRSRFVTGSEVRCGHECRSSGAAKADRRIDSGKMPRRANERFSLVNSAGAICSCAYP